MSHLSSAETIPGVSRLDDRRLSRSHPSDVQFRIDRRRSLEHDETDGAVDVVTSHRRQAPDGPFRSGHRDVCPHVGQSVPTSVEVDEGQPTRRSTEV